MGKRKVAQKGNKIDANSIKLYGPIPRTLMTLVTVLVVSSTFGIIGWRQLQSSKALTASEAQTLQNNQVTSNSDYYASTSTSKQASTTYPSNFRSRLLFLGILIVATLALLLVLKMWT